MTQEEFENEVSNAANRIFSENSLFLVTLAEAASSAARSGLDMDQCLAFIEREAKRARDEVDAISVEGLL